MQSITAKRRPLTEPVSHSAEAAKIKVVHNVVGGAETTIDIYIDGRILVSSLRYRSVSEYIGITPGTHKVEVKPGGAQAILLHGDIRLDPDKHYTIIAHGKVEIPDTLSLLILENTASCPIKTEAYVRFIHTAAHTPPVDFYANGLRLFNNIMYGQHAGGNISSGTANFEVRLANTNNAIFGPAPLHFERQMMYSVIISGIPGNPVYPMSILFTEDSRGMCIYA